MSETIAQTIAVTVIKQTDWIFGKNSCSAGGQIGKVTHAKIDATGVEFYVRENITGIDSFEINSNERWGDKESHSPVRRERQSLELLVPKGNWDEVAEAVKANDPLGRPVRKTRAFTLFFVAEVFKGKQVW